MAVSDSVSPSTRLSITIISWVVHQWIHSPVGPCTGISKLVFWRLSITYLLLQRRPLRNLQNNTSIESVVLNGGHCVGSFNRKSIIYYIYCFLENQFSFIASHLSERIQLEMKCISFRVSLKFEEIPMCSQPSKDWTSKCGLTMMQCAMKKITTLSTRQRSR